MKATIKADANVSDELLRSLGQEEDKDGHCNCKPGDEIEIPREALWRFGIYDQESFNEKLGHLFEKPKGLTKRPAADAKTVEAKEKKIAKEAAEVELEANKEIEEIAEKEAKK